MNLKTPILIASLFIAVNVYAGDPLTRDNSQYNRHKKQNHQTDRARKITNKQLHTQCRQIKIDQKIKDSEQNAKTAKNSKD